MGLAGTIQSEIQSSSEIAPHLTPTSQGKPNVAFGWVKGSRPYLTIRYIEAPAGPVPISGKTMRQAELNIDVWHNGPSVYGAETVANLVIHLLDQRHIPDNKDERIVYRISDSRSAHIPEADESVAHWNVSFSVRWYRSAFADKLISRG
jgi:hypothetical protein